MLDNIPSISEKVGPTAVQKKVGDIVQKVLRFLDEKVNGRPIEIYENILIDIVSKQRIYEYDTQASYYPKLLSLVDLQDDIALESDAGVSYRVRDYRDIVFTRQELEEIGNRYTQLKFPELSQKVA